MQLKGTIQESSWLLRVYPGIIGIVSFDTDAAVIRDRLQAIQIRHLLGKPKITVLCA